MIVVADSGPLHYLILLEHVELLRRFYGQALVPEPVAKNWPPLARRHRARVDHGAAHLDRCASGPARGRIDDYGRFGSQ